MRLLKNLLIALVAVVVVFAVAGALLPRTAHVERSIEIDAPPLTVFTLVNGFQRFNEWSPWADIDPAGTEYSISGPTTGVGARMSWSSDNPRVGVGSQEIVRSEPIRRVDTVLDFGAQGTADAFFVLEPSGGGTRVTWGFETDFGWNLVGRYLGFFMFDAALGGDYESGLDNLRQLAEGLPKADWSDLEPEIVSTEAQPLAFSAGSVAAEPDQIADAVEAALQQVQRYLRRAGVEAAGPPVVLARERTEDVYSFQAGLPYAGEPRREPRQQENVELGSTPATRAVTAVHVGPVTELPATYAKLEAWAAVHGVALGSGAWETPVVSPDDVPEETPRMRVFLPIE
jgi:effector-binding domain-containing protein